MDKMKLMAMVLSVIIAGIVFAVTREGFDFFDSIRSISSMSPKVMGLVALPLFFLAFVLGGVIKKRNEERKWKKVLMESRVKKTKREAKKRAEASTDQSDSPVAS